MRKVLSILKPLNLRPTDFLPQREVVEFVRHFRLNHPYKSKPSREQCNVSIGWCSQKFHTTKYSNLVDAVQFMGCDYFKHLSHGHNTKYKSQQIIGEFLQIMAVQMEKEQLQGVLSSGYFSLMIDETTDVAVLNEMVIYARYIENGKVSTSFLKICELFNGTVDTIETTLVAYMEDKGLSMSKMVGLGTDGASVMTAVHNGVGARFKRRQPVLTSIHCVCHCLALAAAQAGNDVPYI